jgi:phosphate uptake regulator
MKRKIIKQGNNTLTITLPKKWCENSAIKPGSEIEVTEKEGNLIIGKEVDTSEKKTTKDITGLDRSTILLLIQGLYRYGYDYVEIISKDTTIPHHRTNKKKNLSELIYEVSNRLVGAEVISTSKKRYVIKKLTKETMEDFPTVLRRVFLLLNEMTDSFITIIKENDKDSLKSIEFQHNNIKKFINLCLRLLNKFGYEDSKKTCFYFKIISLVSKIEDIIKNSSRYMLKHNIYLKSKSAIELLKDIKNQIRLYYELFYNYNLKKIAELDKQRDIIREKLFKNTKKLSKEENLLIGGLSQIIEIILDMTETRMALED